MEFIYSILFLWQVLSDYETQGSLLLNSSQDYFHFCEFDVPPVGVFPFNQETVANDVSPNKGTGKAVGTSFAPGIHGEPGGSIETHGNATSYIELNKGSLDTRKSITILLYMYPLGDPSPKAPIVNFKKDGHGVQILEEAGSVLLARMNTRQTTFSKVIQSREGLLPANQWHYIGASYNWSQGIAKLWHDGQEVASLKVLNEKTDIDTRFEVRIGARDVSPGATDSFFRGRVACLQFYSSALTQRQIAKAKIACHPFKPVNIIKLVVRHKSRYIEVNENITLAVYNDKNATFSVYTFDVGDGSPVTESDEDKIHHRYSKDGIFTVVALIYSRCRNQTLRVFTTVTVERPLELMGNLTLSCDPVPFPASALVVLETNKGSDFTCQWNFTDGHTSVTNYTVYGAMYYLRHTFNSTGNYSVHVVCENRLSRAEASTIIIVQVPINGLLIDQLTPQTYQKGFRVNWRVQNGSDIDYSASFAGKQLKTSKSLDELHGWAWVRPEDHVGSGVYDVTVTATNRVSAMARTTETVRIETEVEPFQPYLFPPNKDIEVNETLVLFMSRVNEVNGVKPIYRIDLGDGKTLLETRSSGINVSYSIYGEFVVTINASNNVSFFNTSIPVKIQKPVLLIRDLKLATEPTIFTTATKINVTMEKASDVVCNATFGDSSSKLFDLRERSVWDSVQNPAWKQNLPDVKFVITHNYSKVGVYMATVTCHNRLSQKTSKVTAIVQVPVTGARLVPNLAVEFGQSIIISVEITSGTDVDFELDFQGYKYQQRFDGTIAFQLVDQSVYQAAALHRFTVTVWNLVTSPLQIQGYVIVEIPIYGLSSYVIGGSRVIEVNESVQIGASVKQGSSPEYSFDFGDGSIVLVTRNSVIQHMYHFHSSYQVKVTARNNVSQVSAMLNISVVKPVLLLKGLLVTTSPTVVNDTAELDLHVSEGSDFTCHWQFGDGENMTSSYIHLKFYADGMTTDKLPFQNLTFQAHHRYKSDGLFNILVTCQNRLSSVTVTAILISQTLVKGLSIHRLATRVVGQDFKVSWSITSGTNATFNVTFPGANITTVHFNSSKMEGFIHAVLSTPGQYVLRVEASNLVSPMQAASAVIFAEVPVGELSVNLTYESRDLEIDQNATFAAHLGTGTSPTFLFDFGDGSNITNLAEKVVHKYGFNDVYMKISKVIYQVLVTAFNNVSSINSTVEVTVHKPVLLLQNIKLITSPSNVSENASIILTVEHGSDYLCTCDFGDKNISKEIILPGVNFLGEDKTPAKLFHRQSYRIIHDYDMPSIYQLYIECKNRLSEERNETDIVIQEPIAGLRVFDIPPLRFNESFHISWEISNGTDVDFEVLFASVTFQDLGKSRKIMITPDIYKRNDTFKITVMAKNLVSRANTQTSVVIEYPVAIVNLVAVVQEQKGVRGGYGVFHDHFPAEHEITFTVFTTGSNLMFQWQIDDVTVNDIGESSLKHRFPRMGRHNISVTVKNKVSRAQSSLTVIIHNAIKDPVLVSNSPQKLKQPIKFHLLASQFGTDSCFLVGFGDGTNSTYGHPGCNARNGTPDFVEVPTLGSVQFRHVYRDIGRYNVTLNASNVVSFVTVHADVELVQAHCASPQIMIDNLGVNSNIAKRLWRTSRFTVHTDIDLDCEATTKVNFKWRLLSLNPDGPQRGYHDNIILTERELNIPRKHLEYGLYEVHFTAQMALPNTDKYQSTAIGYLRVVPSPLVANIDGGNLVSRGFGKVITIDASMSRDPDVDLETDFGLQFTWMCRSIHTQFPPGDYPIKKLTSPYDTTRQTAGPSSPHSRGCYGDGRFLFSSHNESLSLNTAKMMENETYVVFVIVEKGARIAHQYQVVEVVPGDPPVSRIDCKQNCEDKICASKRFTLFASCFEGCIGRIIYKWEVYQNVANNSEKLWILKDDIIQQVTVKDRSGPVFALPKNVFEGNTEYLIRLYGRREKGVKGKSEKVFLTNDIPKGGACFSSPTRGEALVTKFHIWCENWEDPDAPLSYEFYYKNEEGKLIVFFYGAHNYTYSELPLGDSTRNYTLDIYVKILDSLKGEANYSFLLQSGEPELQGDALGDKLANMTSGEDSEMSRLVNVGDSQAALRLAGAVNSLLNAQSSKIPSNETKQDDNMKEKRKAVRTSIIKAATSLPVTSLEGLQQSADMIASAAMFKDETSTSAMNSSTEAFGRMALLLKSSSNDSAGYDAVVSGAESLLSGMGQVLNAAGSSATAKPKKIATTAAPTTGGPFDFSFGFVKKEKNQDLTEESDEEDVELESDVAQGRDAANNIVGMLGSVSGSILENKLEGEQPSIISSAKLNMAVERSDPDSLGGSSIGDGDAGFQMPSVGNLFGNSSNPGVVEKQMTAMKENPFTWGKKSSDISGKVVSLSFSSQGQSLGVSHLNDSDPIDVFIPRDAPVQAPDQFMYNHTVHRGWRVHKLKMEKTGSAVNVDVRLVGSTRRFELYVRFGKPPTASEYDWRKVLMNFTDDELAGDRPTAIDLVNATNITQPLSSNSKLLEKRPDSNLSLFLSQKRIDVGTYFIGIKFDTMSKDEQSVPPTSVDNNFTVTYTLRTYKSRCLYWNEEFQKWKSDGCEVGNLTTTSRTHCRCTHLTAFGSMMDVAPNPIDFSAVAAGFSNMFASGNVSVFFLVVSLFLFYPLLLFWARRADKKDMEQIGATPIPNTIPFATYHYELTFFTGQRRGAATTAQVSCTLIGEKFESGLCILKDEKRAVFKQGSANSFLISVDKSLGPIESLRVWHDNYGLSPAWFLKRVLLRDIQSDEVWVFICERWFALDEDDGQIVRLLTPAGEKDLTSFSRVFNSKLYKDFTDAHLWFSVLLKPSRSTFTRAQRLSCCICLLCTAMVASAMFYGQGAVDDRDNIVLGPIKLNLKSMMIGLQSSLVIIPVNIVVVTIFKSVKVKGSGKRNKKGEAEQTSKDTGDEYNCAVNHACEPDDEWEVGTAENLSQKDVLVLEDVVCDSVDENINTGKKRKSLTREKFQFFRKKRDGQDKYLVEPTSGVDLKSTDDSEVASEDLSEISKEEDGSKGWWCCGRRSDKAKKSQEAKELEKKEEMKKKKKKQSGFLPYWCLYVAWFLCISASVTSALFTLFYSMMWGKDKSNQWLVSMLLTFTQDTLLNQPAKVLFLSAIYAIFTRKSEEEIEAAPDENCEKGQDEEWLHSTETSDTMMSDDLEKELLLYKPPEETKLIALRENKLREKELTGKLVSLGDYSCVLIVLLLVSYGNRDPASFSFRNSLEQELIRPGTALYPKSLDNVENLDLFWLWVKNSLIPGLYEHDWYNGAEVTNRTGFTMGRTSTRLGRIRLRQVRVRNGSCTVPELFRDRIFECNVPYDESQDETRMYSPGWKDGFEIEDPDLLNKRSESGQLSPWMHIESGESNCTTSSYGRIATYPAGGYIAEFGEDLQYSEAYIEYLKSTRWIDKYTRAILIEGAIYNPNINLVGVIETKVEFTSSTGALPRVNFKIFRLFSELNPSYAFNAVCEILFFVLVFYTLYTIIKGIYVQKKVYFHSTISWLNMVFFVNGIAILVVFIMRASRLKNAVETLKTDQESFFNFAECGQYTETIVYLFAFADFIAILKFLNFLSFTRIVQLLSTTIFRSLAELQSFAVMLFAIFMAYGSMAYTVYGPYLEDYKALSTTLESLMALIMGVFDHEDFITQTDYKVVGYFFFASFSTSMMFVFTNVVITIISIVYQEVQADEELKKCELSFFNIIFERLLLLVGFRGVPERKLPTIEEPSIEELQWNLSVQYVMDSQLRRLNRHVNTIYINDEMKEVFLFNLFSELEDGISPFGVNEQIQKRSSMSRMPVINDTADHRKPMINDAADHMMLEINETADHRKPLINDTADHRKPVIRDTADDMKSVIHDTADRRKPVIPDTADHRKKHEPRLRPNAGARSRRAYPETADNKQHAKKPGKDHQKASIETLSQLIAKKQEELQKLEREGRCDENERTHRVKVMTCLQDLLDKTIAKYESRNVFMSHEEESDV